MPRVLKITAVFSSVLLLAFATMVVMRYLRFVTLSRVARTTVEIAVLQTASTNYFDVFKEWPRSIQDFTHNRSNILFIRVEQPTNDAWGRPVIYEQFEANRGYGRVLSYGRDGKPGGSGPDADIERRFGP
jgi:general secretion pathway protein G